MIVINKHLLCCYIRISMNNLKDIHNTYSYLTRYNKLLYQDFNELFCCKSTEKMGNMQIYKKIF